MDLKVTAQEGINQIKKLLFGMEDLPLNPPVDEQEFEMTEYKLEDGTSVMIDKLAEGGQVVVGDSPAPDGEHTLEDGTVLTTLGGLIASVKPKVEREEVEVEIEAGKDKQYMTKEDFESFKKEILSKFSAQQSANQKTIEVLETIMKFEVEKPIKETVDFDSMTPLQRRRYLKNA